MPARRGRTLVIRTEQVGWFGTSLHDNITSIGVVAPFDYLFKGRTDYAKTYDEEVDLCPGVKSASRRRRSSPAIRHEDYSYRRSRWRRRLVLVGDALAS